MVLIRSDQDLSKMSEKSGTTQWRYLSVKWYYLAVRQVIEESFCLVGHRDKSHNIISVPAILGQLATADLEHDNALFRHSNS